MTDRDRTTRWESGPQTDRTAVEVDLGSVRTVAGIDLFLGPFVEDFPRGLIIEASEDGQSWREVWQGGSAGLAFVGGLRGTARRAAAVPVSANAGAIAADEADEE